MDYEKLYKQALEKARKGQSVEQIFPELSESEDDVIIKGIIQYLEQSEFGEEPYHIDGDVVIKYIDWLERQGSQNFANSTKTCKTKHTSVWSEEDEKIRDEIILYIGSSKGIGISTHNRWLSWLEKQGVESQNKPTPPVWKYKKDNTPLLRDSLILNKYGCVAKSPSGAIVSDVWVIDYDELAKLPKEEYNKQNNQKSADKVEPKFKVGDWVRAISSGNIFKILSVNDELYRVLCYDGVEVNYPIIDVEKDLAYWTIQDAKEGDVLCMHSSESNYDCVFLYQNTYEFEPNINVAAAYCCIYIYMRPNKIELGIQGPDCIDIRKIEPATEYHRNLLFQKMKEAGYEWDSEKKELKNIEWIDLGLPSGTLWKSTNETGEHTGYYTYDDAVNIFGDQLPTKEQFDELKEKCRWEWKENGYKVTSPNGNSIFLTALGFRGCNDFMHNNGTYGNYWSSTLHDSENPWSLYFTSSGVFTAYDSRCYRESVRLVKNKQQ